MSAGRDENESVEQKGVSGLVGRGLPLYQRLTKPGYHAAIFGIAILGLPAVIYFMQLTLGRPLSAFVLTYMATLLASLVVSMVWLVAAEYDGRRIASERILRGYIESLRRYAVAADESTNRLLVRVATEHIALREAAQPVIPPPPEEVPPSARDADRPLKTRERDTLLRIIYGMAIAAPYNFDPAAKRGEAAATIASATAAAGCRVDDDTVRKYLKQAAEQNG